MNRPQFFPFFIGLSVAAFLIPSRADQNATSWEHAPTDYVVPAGMAYGGAFIDRILPMPVDGPLRSDVWGGDNVKPRNADNGLEDPDWSYWCMSVFHNNGKEHMFAVRWPEDSPKGHGTWPRSSVVHAVADQATGPFKVTQEIGPGHNVMCYQAKDGTYVLYVINGAYTSRSLDGPWEKFDLRYDTRGTAPVSMTNHTFAKRDDGSYLMVSRGGHIWISDDGLKPFQKITTESLYPPVKGRYEDPVVWRDEVQYHLIVNDWFGRTAYYLRSKDGVSWVWDQGKAYDINVATHPDGTRERWYKFERPNIRQDDTGRATHIYFAVIDSRKDLDKGNDEHSSKIIALPLAPQRRLQFLTTPPPAGTPGDLKITLRAEPGFDPQTDVDVASLSFGAPSAVDFGKGVSATRAENSGSDLTITFTGDFALKPSDYCAKLLGKTKTGGLLFSYVLLPGHTTPTATLSPRQPVFTSPDTLGLTVENFGLAASDPASLQITLRGPDRVTHKLSADLPGIAPYGRAEVSVKLPQITLPPNAEYQVEITTPCKGSQPLVTKTKVKTPVSP